jgi:hypothetical protein
MVTVLEECITEEQRSVVFFLWAKGLSEKDIRKEMFPVGSVCLLKRFTTWPINSLKDVRKSQMMHNWVWMWLRQQSKDFYAEGFDAPVKRWDKCISVG